MPHVPRRRVKKPPKPSHVYPSHAQIRIRQDVNVAQEWVAWVLAKTDVPIDTVLPFTDAVAGAYRLGRSGIPTTICATPAPEGGTAAVQLEFVVDQTPRAGAM